MNIIQKIRHSFHLKRTDITEYAKLNKLSIKLYATTTFWGATCEEKRAVCNGCGAKDAIKIPESFLGLDISLACNIHDWMYHEGKTQSDRQFADAMFRLNMAVIIEEVAFDRKGKILSFPRHFAASIYYASVVKWGKKAFWIDKDTSRKFDLDITYKGRFQNIY